MHNLPKLCIIILSFGILHCAASKGRLSESLSKQICHQAHVFSTTEQLQPPLKDGSKYPQLTPCKVVVWKKCETAGAENCAKFKTKASNHCAPTPSSSKIRVDVRKSKMGLRPRLPKYKHPIIKEITESYDSKEPEVELRIVGGTDAKPHEFPFVVHFTSSGGKTFCGGSIVNEMYILTAAHCFEHDKDFLKSMTLTAGDHNIVEDDGTEQILVIDKLLQHERYNGRTKENDIALVKLKHPLKYTYAVQKVNLPEKRREGQKRLRGDVVVVGWGLLEDNWEELQPDILQKVTVPIVRWKTCMGIWLDKNFWVPKNTICASFLITGGKDSCRGDSGGPLMKKVGPGSYVIVGIVSFGSECGSAFYPAVYTDVAMYIDWISENSHMPSSNVK